MNAYVILAFAIIAEVFGSSMMKLSNGFKKLYPTLGVIAGMVMKILRIIFSFKNNPIRYCLCNMVWSRYCTYCISWDLRI